MLLMVFSSSPSTDLLCPCWEFCPCARELCREPRPSCLVLPWFCQSVWARPRSSAEPKGELGLSGYRASLPGLPGLLVVVEVALEGRPT